MNDTHYGNTAAVALHMSKSNVGTRTKLFNSGGYYLKDASSGRITAEFYRAGEDDGLVALCSETITLNLYIHRVRKKETKMFSVISPTKLWQL